jgi:hypothetical protein
MADAPIAVDRALRDLAQTIETESPSGQLMTVVLERVAAEPVPERSGIRIALGRCSDWLRERLRWVIGVLVALVLTGVVVSPVGAQVADWFGFHGVAVSVDPDADVPSGTPVVPRAEGGLTLDEAAGLVDFEPAAPAQLGPPDAVSVSADRRLVSMSWTAATTGAGTIRLDQFDAEVSPFFWKMTPEAVFLRVGNLDGLWFPTPHEVVLLDASGDEETVPARLAAQTLIWADGEHTFRLEGDFTQARALEIARSVP